MIINKGLPFFNDASGAPLESGYIFIGTVNLNPETTPISIYWDPELTQAANQPLRTSGGYIVNTGTSANVYTNSNYSMTVRDKNGVLVYSLRDSADTDPAANLPITLTNIAALRGLAKGGQSQAFVQGYYTQGDGGGGYYYYDPLDTTSPDNGGTTIVTVDGSRWKLGNTSTVTFVQFGAKGDGVTDDTPSIQNALTWASGRTILGDSGRTYNISSQLTIRTKTVMRGSDTFKLSPIFPAGVFAFQNETKTGALNEYYDNNIVIDGLTFDGNNNLTRTASAFDFAKVLNLTIKNCVFRNFTGIVIANGANKNTRITLNTFENNGRPKPSAISTPCIWSDSGVWGIPYDLTIEHNTFRNNNWSCAYFMPIGGSFSFNYCVDNGESGVFSNPNGKDLRYIGNHIQRQVRSNISASGIETNASGSVISNNIITGNGSDGISITDTDNIVVTNNIIFSNGQEPIQFPAAAGVAIITINPVLVPDHIRIANNRIGDRQAVKTQKYGIAIGGPGAAVKRFAIHDNDLTEQGTQGLYIAPEKWGESSYVSNLHNVGGSILPPIKSVEIQAPAVTGNFDVTGVGFRPRAIEILSTLPGAEVFQSQGVLIPVPFGGSGLQTTHFITIDSGKLAGSDIGRVVGIKTSAGVDQCVATVAAFTQDGVTLNFTTALVRPWMIVKCYP